MTRSAPWSEYENAAVVVLYFAMLDKAMADEKYNKAGMIRAAQNGHGGTEGCAGALIDRNRGSIEFKLMNCTAAHQDLRPQDETMHDHGYRALPNYQADLKTAMRESIEIDAIEAADRPAAAG